MIKTLGEIPKPVHVKGIEPIPPYYTPLGTDGKPAKILKGKNQRQKVIVITVIFV